MGYRGTSVLPVNKGGTGATTLAGAGIVETTGDQSLAGALTAMGGITVGSSGTPLVKLLVFTVSFTPAATSPDSSNSPNISCPGVVLATDTVIAVNPPGSPGTAGVGIMRWSVAADDLVRTSMVNVAGGSRTMTSGTYRVLVART